MDNERTINFVLVLDGREFVDMLGYDLPRIGETLAVDGELYEVKAVARQYMTLHGSHVREESSAAVTVERVHKGYAMRGG